MGATPLPVCPRAALATSLACHHQVWTRSEWSHSTHCSPFEHLEKCREIQTVIIIMICNSTTRHTDTDNHTDSTSTPKETSINIWSTFFGCERKPECPGVNTHKHEETQLLFSTRAEVMVGVKCPPGENFMKVLAWMQWVLFCLNLVCEKKVDWEVPFTLLLCASEGVCVQKSVAECVT